MWTDKSHKILNSIIIFLLFILFSIFYAKEYFYFHEWIKNKEEKLVVTENKLLNFSLQNIREINSVSFYATPNKNMLSTISEKIKSAKNKVYVEAYIFTEKDLRSALIKAKKNWVDVKVVMEKNVYMANNINKKTYDEFIKNKIDVIRADSSDYSLNHSKFFIIDDEVILSTWNFSYSMFTKNRDFILSIKDEKIHDLFVKNFKLDFSKDKDFVYDENLLISPFFSRSKIETMLKNAKGDIKMYFPYFEDERLIEILENKINAWVNIEIITDKKNERIEEFSNMWFEVVVMPKFIEHAKSILVDWEYLYIWSINFSKYSLDKNREIWILIKNKDIIDKFNKIFIEDFK